MILKQLVDQKHIQIENMNILSLQTNHSLSKKAKWI